jgi:hypothetical protein
MDCRNGNVTGVIENEPNRTSKITKKKVSEKRSILFLRILAAA